MRLSKIEWAIFGSLTLHAVLGAILWPRTPPQLASARTVVIQAELISEKPATEAFLLPNTASPSAPDAVPPTTPDRPDKHDAHGARDNVLPQSPAMIASQEGYLPIDMVDQPAVPQGDWLIDTDVLPRGYTLRLILQLWISASGQIDRWNLVNDVPNPALAQQALALLEQTPIRPALLHHVAVPSFRQLEVVVTRE